MRLVTLSVVLVAALVGAVLAQPQLQPGVFSALRVSGAATVGSLSDPSAQELDVLSGASGVSGGFRVSRTLNGSYTILNTNTGGASGVGYLQAGDATSYRPLDIQPLGGGIRVGDTAAGSVINSIVAASSTWDPGSVGNGNVTGVSTTVTGANATSVCFAGLVTLGSEMSISAQGISTNLVRVTITNNTGSTIDPVSGTLRVVCFNVT